MSENQLIINKSSSISSSDKMEARCEKCGHEWEYKGGLVKATCPSCGNKVKVRDIDE